MSCSTVNWLSRERRWSGDDLQRPKIPLEKSLSSSSFQASVLHRYLSCLHIASFMAVIASDVPSEAFFNRGRSTEILTASGSEVSRVLNSELPRNSEIIRSISKSGK